MKIVLAPDSFKGSATALEVCQAMAEGILEADPSAEIVMAPMADGGEGTVENLTAAYGGQLVEIDVAGPTWRPVKAKYGIIGDNLCVIESAESSGLAITPEDQRNPSKTTTYGLGQLILNGLNRGCRTFVIGLGGSATNDGGCGMAAALGYEFLDAGGNKIDTTGGSLDRLASINTVDADPRIRESEFLIACDVTNPLCGPEGASHVFGPQKGADPEMVIMLDNNLRHLADIIRRDFGRDLAAIPGAGAAGGLGAGCVFFLGGQLREGVKIIADHLKLKDKIQGADLVITGEGHCDKQTLKGKTPYGVVQIAREAGVPSIIIAGAAGDGIEPFYQMGVKQIIQIKKDDMTLEYAMMHTKELIKQVIFNIF